MSPAKMEVNLINSMGDDLTVVNAARVSFNKESEWELSEIEIEPSKIIQLKGISERDGKLINYLAKHNHWSPFAHVTLQFRIKAPIFVARQLVKHQVGFAWNEVSMRYIDASDDSLGYYLPPTWRASAENVKQGSDPEMTVDTFTLYFDDGCNTDVNITDVVEEYMKNQLNLYKSLIRGGVAKEQARMVLPINMMTEWYWTGSLYAFARVCNLRLKPDAQSETRDIAKAISEACKYVAPLSWKALTNA